MKIFSFVFCISLAYSGAILADTIKLGADIWCPYNCDPQDANQGYVVDIAKIAFEKNGHKLEYSVLPWAQAIIGTRASKLSGIIAASKGDAPDFVFGEVPLAINQECFFVTAKDTWTFTNVNSLADGKITGTVKNYSYAESLTSYFKTNPKQIDAASGESPIETNFRKLATGKISRFVDNVDVANNYLNRTKRQGLFKNVGCVISDPLYVGFDPNNPKSKEYAKQFDDTIRDLKQTGEFAKILAKYGLK